MKEADGRQESVPERSPRIGGVADAGYVQWRLGASAGAVPGEPAGGPRVAAAAGEGYLKLFLLGIFNPVVGTMQGLCRASHLERVQEECGLGPVARWRFSDA